MKYKPGSFSKNFAWHETGLLKLHRVIQKGFRDTPAPVARDQFRKNSGLDDALGLIPINFFLHNQAGSMSVDELVHQAISQPHSLKFDRLALFAFHLNRVGSGRGVVSRPAMWANEFVRERLWNGGAWLSSALQDEHLDSFVNDRMDARPNVQVKCRNNYRHLYDLCDYRQTSLKFVNSHAVQWIESALYLTWDRHLLDGGDSDGDSLLALIESEELYKLLGVTESYAVRQAESFSDDYISVGCLDRFSKLKFQMAHPENQSSTNASSDSNEGGLDWLLEQESVNSVERRSVERKEQIRNPRIAVALKQLYDDACQFCGTQLEISENLYYSEAAHIKALGKPHNGPDKVSNMLVLCPNHHMQFDRGILRLEKNGPVYNINSKVSGDLLNGKPLTLLHDLDEMCVKYHFEWFSSKRL